MKDAKYFRDCSSCKTKLGYSTKYRRDCQEKKNGLCYSCRAKLRPPMKEETKKKISEKAIKKFSNFTDEQWKKIREDGHKYGLRQLPLTEEHRLARCGSGNNFYGHYHTEESKRKIGDRTRGSKLPLDHKIKISKGLIRSGSNIGDKNGMKSPAARLKVRLSIINKLKELHGQIKPFYNKSGCKYFDNLSISNGWNVQHAENGGEHYIKELGYWLDGYDQNKNIVIEYDERKHYNVDGTLKDKDFRRMNEIVDHLKCSFYRYNHSTQELKKYF